MVLVSEQRLAQLKEEASSLTLPPGTLFVSTNDALIARLWQVGMQGRGRAVGGKCGKLDMRCGRDYHSPLALIAWLWQVGLHTCVCLGSKQQRAEGVSVSAGHAVLRGAVKG